MGNKVFTWKNGRELATYSDGNKNLSFKYDFNGVRTSKIVNGVETKYYVENNKIIFEDRNGDVLYYFYSGDELLGFVYKDVKENVPGAFDRYIQLLRSGGSKYPVEQAKEAGVDFTKKDAYIAVVERMDTLVAELEKLLTEE